MVSDRARHRGRRLGGCLAALWAVLPARVAAESQVQAAETAAGYVQHVREASVLYTIPTALIWAVMHAESRFNPRAVSRRGAQGLMQLMPSTAREMGVREILDPRQNILGGSRFLRLMLNAFAGDVAVALAAYNAGPVAVRKYGGVPRYRETQHYVRRVMAQYQRYRQLGL